MSVLSARPLPEPVEPEATATGASAALSVHELGDGDTGRWDAFVESCPRATFFHRAGWQQVVRRALGHRTHFLYAERAGRIEGVLPMGHVHSRLFGNALVSAPFLVYGGIAAENDAAGAALEEAAQALARRLGVDYLELRHREARREGPPAKDLYVTFRKEISADSDENLKAIPRKQRAMVRKGIQAGLVGEVDAGVDRFYDVYSESVRNLGTPVMSRRWYRTIHEVFGKDCEVLTITKDGAPVASVMSFYFRDEVLPYYGGSVPAGRGLKANDFMYWELMRRAAERGIRVFDYGRSKVGTGSYSFKKNWGFEPEPLHYEYFLVRARHIPNVSPTNPKYRLFISLWQRLPLPVTRILGPWVARNLV